MTDHNGESRADAEAAELVDPVLLALGQARARYGDMEVRVAELEAVIAEARELLAARHCPEEDHDDALTTLSAAPSDVLAEVKAAVWDEGVAVGAQWEFDDNESRANGGPAVPRPASPYREETHE